jgi:hypothetical protein
MHGAPAIGEQLAQFCTLPDFIVICEKYTDAEGKTVRKIIAHKIEEAVFLVYQTKKERAAVIERAVQLIL